MKKVTSNNKKGGINLTLEKAREIISLQEEKEFDPFEALMNPDYFVPGYEEAQKKWVQIGSGRKVLFIATEQSAKEIQKMILAYLTGFNESKFRYGNFTEKENRILRQAVYIMEQYKDNFYIVIFNILINIH